MAEQTRALGRKLVLTGGPCAGKTSVATLIENAFKDSVVIVPESASLLLKGGFPRWPESQAIASFQKSIYRLQVEVEAMFSQRYGKKLFILDRGTVDGAAYWPEGPSCFFEALGTTEALEYARYDGVIYLESASEEDYLSNQFANPDRNENWGEASGLDQATRAVWSRHPALSTVPCHPRFADKVLQVVTLIEKELAKV
jgi:predicted ATPase